MHKTTTANLRWRRGGGGGGGFGCLALPRLFLETIFFKNCIEKIEMILLHSPYVYIIHNITTLSSFFSILIPWILVGERECNISHDEWYARGQPQNRKREYKSEDKLGASNTSLRLDVVQDMKMMISLDLS